MYKQEGEKISVLIVDDHEMVRLGLRSYLETQEDIEVVAEACDGQEGIDLAREYQPQVILMDLVMDGMDGIQATRELQGEGFKIVVLTSYVDDDKVFPALEAGAYSYILKTSDAEDIAKCIRKASEGKPSFEGQVTKLMMERRENESAYLNLTNREKEVLRLLGKGFTNQEIADELYIGIKTVKTHVSNILDKLELKDRTQAAIYAKDYGYTN
ncbi:response regulator [Natranaerobius thermophilus]|uniref:Stage 0 sporulation protein A homolog n=1 Tax=Natranaerobius thermophilus (strain ATCC BAA-1301 / DSM 18059 / JW/NM-WN-LF) TaxID=457570 RepID=B2A755_NATTJ|nr:response regulator transcription factor [Natranaerobius thermophilus]ACB85646.1 two component transcriptional regulator, LuxR family [Natranaerobius thermophilus JW/NM-WN-LF]